jgi:hypothetical protein
MVNRLVDRHIYYDTHAMNVGFEEESGTSINVCQPCPSAHKLQQCDSCDVSSENLPPIGLWLIHPNIIPLD